MPKLEKKVEQLWQNLKEAKSAVGLTTVFDASKFPTKISAEVRDWSVADEGEDPKRWEFCGRHTRFAAGAAMQDDNRRALGIAALFDIDLMAIAHIQHPLIVRVDRRIQELHCALLIRVSIHVRSI